MGDNRRDFLRKSGLLGLAGLAGSMFGKENLEKIESLSQQLSAVSQYALPKLPYATDALEPFIDKQTMELHHGKHHQAYVDKLNKALEEYKGDSQLDALFKNTSQLNSAIRNNAGGHYNHSLFWELMKPNKIAASNVPVGELGQAITRRFVSFPAFTEEFSDKALKIFGSGWCWLILDTNKNLKIASTANQDNPLMDVSADKGEPLLALDVWEHAYYLKYQNKRADYIKNWWNLVNWEKAEQLYSSAIKK